MKYIYNAIILAEDSTHPTHRLGCILTVKNKIVARTTNSGKTNPHAPLAYKEGTGLYHQCHHAEFNALKQIDGDWVRGRSKTPLFSNIKAYVARLKADGTPGMARPCENCMGLFKAYGVKQIFYTTSISNIILTEKL